MDYPKSVVYFDNKTENYVYKVIKQRQDLIHDSSRFQFVKEFKIRNAAKAYTAERNGLA